MVQKITIASSIPKETEHTNLKAKLSIFGSNGTPVITGAFNEATHKLEELLDKLLQWATCLVHCTELLLQGMSSLGPLPLHLLNFLT